MTTIDESELEACIEKLYGVAALLEHMTDTRGVVEHNDYAIRILEDNIYDAIEGLLIACTKHDDSDETDVNIDSDE
jgi:hypothetical protein